MKLFYLNTPTSALQITQLVWNVSERSKSDLRSLLREISQRLLRNISKEMTVMTKDDKRGDVFYVTSLRRLEHISKRCLFREVSETSQKHLKRDDRDDKRWQKRWCFLCDVFKTSRTYLKKMSIPWRLWDVSKIYLTSICDFLKIPHENGFVWLLKYLI